MSDIPLSQQGSTLVLFAHPKCPCTRATLGELEKIVARCQGSLTPWVVFFKPVEADASWDQTDLQKTASAIPSVHVVSDPAGIEARRFHATTSGQAFLYSNQGELLFNGGITMARGHAGDNLGRSVIETYVMSRDLMPAASSCHHTPVFGCPIAGSHEQK